MTGFMPLELPAGSRTETTLLDGDTPAGGAALEAAEDAVEAALEAAAARTSAANIDSALDGADIAGMGGGLVTPEMVLAIARRRINDLDEQVSTIMDELNSRTEAAGTISDHLGALRNISTRLEPHYDASGNLNLDATIAIEGGGTQTVREYLESLVVGQVLTLDEANAITNREGMQNMIDDANESLRDVNSGNEMLMIQLQSTMQARTSVIQTATNLLKSIDEASDSIVGNLR
jgi:flagellar hook-associated protein FlgK